MGFTDIVQSFIKGADFPDPKMKCVFACILGEQKLLTDKGVMDIVPLVELLDTLPTKSQDIIMKASAKCPANAKVKDICEKWYLVHECIRKKDPVNYFF